MNILELSRDELVALVARQEAELDLLRPKPPKFRKGQVVFFGNLGHFARILRFKAENGIYWYSHRTNEPPNSYNIRGYWFQESGLTALSATDINGENPDAPSAT